MRAYIPNYQVQFRKWSNSARGGISAIIEVPGELAEAAMYECPESDLTHLDNRLNYYVPEYKRETFKVLGEDNKWLFASGYSPRGSEEQALESGALGFVGKPYGMGELLQRIRAALDSRFG